MSLDILDYSENEKTYHYWFKPMVIAALLSLVMLGLAMQVEAVYSDYIVYKNLVVNSGLMICFYSFYSNRLVVLLIGSLGVLISIAILRKNQWKFPKEAIKKMTLICPVLIFLLDQLLVLFLPF